MPSVYEDIARRQATRKRESTVNVGYILFAIVIALTVIQLIARIHVAAPPPCDVTILGDVAACGVSAD